MPLGPDISTALDYFMARGTAEFKFCWWPERCYISKELLWFKNAYRVRRLITGPGTPIIEDRWFSAAEYIILKIKGKA